MYKISKDEFRKAWELVATEGGISKEQLNSLGHTFDTRDLESREVNLDANMKTTMPEETREPMPKEPTDRYGEAEEILNADVTDNTLSGGPVGGNEEPAATFEEDRSDDDGMASDDEEDASDEDDDDDDGA